MIYAIFSADFMANETKNDQAFINVIGALGNASHLVGYVTNQEDARKVYDTVVHLAKKISEKHGFSLTQKRDVGSKALNP